MVYFSSIFWSCGSLGGMLCLLLFQKHAESIVISELGVLETFL